MAAPTDSQNEVTVRRLSEVVTGTWGKVKEYAVSDVAWDSTNGKLTKTKNGTTSDVVTKSNLLSALGGSIADGNTGFVTGDAVYDKLALKANTDSPTLSGVPKAPTATAGTNSTQIATTAFVKTAVDNAIATADALTYKGTVDGGSTGDYGALTPAASKGDVYKVSAAGKVDGVKVEVGDMLVCNADSTAAATSSNYATIAANWDFIQTNIDGAVSSSSTSVTTNTVAIFDGTTGKVIKSSGLTIGKSVPSNAVFTDASVTDVGNHYTPSGGTSKSASGGTATQLPTESGSSNVQVVTGVTVDAAGHVTGVSSKGLWSPNTTYSSQAAAAGGTTTSLCTTGEKYTWNNKQDLISDLSTIRAQAGGAVRYDASQTLSADQKTQARSNIGAGTSNLTIGTDGSTAAAGNHTHTVSIASDSGTSSLEMAANTKYKLTAGGKTFVFTTPPDTNTTYSFDGTYDSSSNKAATVSSVTSRINALDVTASGMGPDKTLATLTETDGKIAATFQNISISKSQVSDFSHTHGNLANGGAITTSGALATGDALVFTDSSDSDKIKKTSITFDGSTATKALTQKGTWETFNNYTHPTSSGNKHIPSGGSSGQFLGWDSDGTAKWVNNPNSDTKVTQTLVASDNTSEYPILLAPTGQTATATTTSNFVTGAKYKPSTNTLTVNISGNAATASKINTSAAIGSNTKSIYVAADGTVTAGSNYAGGTKVTLNGTAKGASTAEFYAPTGAGTSGQVLKSSGSGAPSWGSLAASDVGITVTSSSVSDGTNTFNKYTHPTSSGNKHIPSGGSSGQFLGWSADGTAAWVNNPNTDTVDPAKLGSGYGTCGTAEATAAKAATLSGYVLRTGGHVSVKFTYAVPASATLNINSAGAKAIYYRGAAITAGVIGAGDIATFVYDGTQYQLLSVDSGEKEMTDQEVTDLLAALT